MNGRKEIKLLEILNRSSLVQNDKIKVKLHPITDEIIVFFKAVTLDVIELIEIDNIASRTELEVCIFAEDKDILEISFK